MQTNLSVEQWLKPSNKKFDFTTTPGGREQKGIFTSAFQRFRLSNDIERIQNNSKGTVKTL